MRAVIYFFNIFCCLIMIHPLAAQETALTTVMLPTGIEPAAAIGSWQVNVFPNPVHDLITLEIIGMSNNGVSVELFNIYGQKINTLFTGTANLTN